MICLDEHKKRKKQCFSKFNSHILSLILLKFSNKLAEQMYFQIGTNVLSDNIKQGIIRECISYDFGGSCAERIQIFAIQTFHEIICVLVSKHPNLPN